MSNFSFLQSLSVLIKTAFSHPLFGLICQSSGEKPIMSERWLKVSWEVLMSKKQIFFCKLPSVICNMSSRFCVQQWKQLQFLSFQAVSLYQIFQRCFSEEKWKIIFFSWSEGILFVSPKTSSRLNGNLNNLRDSFKWEWKELSMKKPPTKGKVF